MSAPEGSPVVSVIIPVRDQAGRLHRCLDALRGQRAAGSHPLPPFEVIVVDNGSRDDGVAVARSHPVAPTVLVEPRPGSYAARNRGAAAARGEILAFTDADCVPEADWVSRGWAASHPVGAPVGGAIVALCGADPSVWERYDRALYLDQADLVAQGFAATANLWVPRAVWQQVGPFDPTLRSSGDLEWGRRASRAGHRTGYAGAVRVGHPPRASLRATWALHRRLGAGWAVLRARGEWPSLREDRSWRVPLGEVIDAVAGDGPALRRRQLAGVHLLAMTARLSGLLSGGRGDAHSTSRRAR